MQSSPVWVPWNGYKQCYVPMASIESTLGRKLVLFKVCFLVLSQHLRTKIMGLPPGVLVASPCFSGTSTKNIFE